MLGVVVERLSTEVRTSSSSLNPVKSTNKGNEKLLSLSPLAPVPPRSPTLLSAGMRCIFKRAFHMLFNAVYAEQLPSDHLTPSIDPPFSFKLID